MDNPAYEPEAMSRKSSKEMEASSFSAVEKTAHILSKVARFCSVAKRSHSPSSPKGQTHTILKSGYSHLATMPPPPFMTPNVGKERKRVARFLGAAALNSHAY